MALCSFRYSVNLQQEMLKEKLIALNLTITGVGFRLVVPKSMNTEYF